MAYALVRPVRLSLDTFARTAGMHPDLVRRFAALGLLQPSVDSAGRLWFGHADITAVARIGRLRTGLGLNYAAIGVVLDLLSRIDELEAQLRASHGRREVKPWR
jgi:DNA-binding transcriptional MerR regulator